MFEWDRVKARENESKHGISFADTFGVFEDLAALTVDEFVRGEERHMTIGVDASGQLLAVAYAWRDENIRIISARKVIRSSEVRKYVEAQYSVSNGRRGAILPKSGKTARTTIHARSAV